MITQVTLVVYYNFSNAQRDLRATPYAHQGSARQADTNKKALAIVQGLNGIYEFIRYARLALREFRNSIASSTITVRYRSGLIA